MNAMVARLPGWAQTVLSVLMVPVHVVAFVHRLLTGYIGAWAIYSGATIFTVGAGYWMAKYFWGLKLLPFLDPVFLWLGLTSASANAGVAAGSTWWISWFVIAFLGINGTNLAFADYRHKATMVLDILSSILPAAIIGYAWVDRYRGLLTLNAAQTEALHVFTGMVIIDMVLFSLIAARLNRLYFGDIAGGGQGKG